MTNPLDKILGPSQELLDLFEQLKKNEEVKKFIVTPADLPVEKQRFLELIGVTSERLYYVPDVADMSSTLYALRDQIDIGLLGAMYTLGSEPVEMMAQRFTNKGYPARFVKAQAKDVELTGVDIVIDGVSYIVLLPTF